MEGGWGEEMGIDEKESCLNRMEDSNFPGEEVASSVI